MANIRQSRPDAGLGSEVIVFQTFEVLPSSLGIGTHVLCEGVWLRDPKIPNSNQGVYRGGG